LKPFDEKGSKRGWEPFLHLSIGDGVWELHKAGQRSNVPAGKPNKSRSYFLSYADEAVISPQLLGSVSTPGERTTLRNVIFARLASDSFEKSQRLLQIVAPGYAVDQMKPPPTMDFEVGRVYDRQRDIHARFGGQAQGGISTPTGCPAIFLFTGESGERYGYSDDWGGDDVFLYTGEGQEGDMLFVRGNKAIRDHVSNGKDLLLFRAIRKGQGYRYLGQFICTSWEFRVTRFWS
jgi:hypothetical protein